MTTSRDALLAHLGTGVTTVARCLSISRTDGVWLGFTDHDRDIAFAGGIYRAATGAATKAMVQSLGLSVDNTEIVGAVSSEAVREDDLRAGRYDGARAEVWQVNWADPASRMLVFSGTIGEVSLSNGRFTAELRGLSAALNTSQGRVFHTRCSAVLGDASCGVDLNLPEYGVTTDLVGVSGGQELGFGTLSGFADGWFRGGKALVVTGDASGLTGHIRDDRISRIGARIISLWEPLEAAPAVGDLIRISAGCDRAASTCRDKFMNFLNFRGFPDIPGEDWLMTVPQRAGVNDGGSRRG